MPKERPQYIKVRPRSAIERAPSLGAAVRIACTRADDRTVRLRPHMPQNTQSRLQGVESVRGARCHRHGGSWLAALSSWYGRARVSSRTVGGGAGRLRPMLAAW